MEKEARIELPYLSREERKRNGKIFVCLVCVVSTMYLYYVTGHSHKTHTHPSQSFDLVGQYHKHTPHHLFHPRSEFSLTPPPPPRPPNGRKPTHTKYCLGTPSSLPVYNSTPSYTHITLLMSYNPSPTPRRQLQLGEPYRAAWPLILLPESFLFYFLLPHLIYLLWLAVPSVRNGSGRVTVVLFDSTSVVFHPHYPTSNIIPTPYRQQPPQPHPSLSF